MRLLSIMLLSLCVMSAKAASTPLEYHLRIENHAFVPAEITVPAGQKFKLFIENADRTVEEFESISLRREKIIPGQSNARISIGPLHPGEYDFFGEFHADTAQGKIIVR